MKYSIPKYQVVLAKKKKKKCCLFNSLFVVLSKQEDHEVIGNVIAFFLPFLACVFQVR